MRTRHSVNGTVPRFDHDLRGDTLHGTQECYFMPFFVFSHMSTMLGLQDMVDSTCWDMLCSIETYRHTCPSIEVGVRS